MNEIGVSDKEFDIIISVLKKYEQIEKAVVFGSRAKGNYEKYSDVDIALFGENANKVVGSVLTDFDEEYIIYEFDIVAYNSITNEALKEHINRVGKTIYEKAGEKH